MILRISVPLARKSQRCTHSVFRGVNRKPADMMMEQEMS